MIVKLKIIKSQLENKQVVDNQVAKINKKNVSISKQKNKSKNNLNSEPG